MCHSIVRAFLNRKIFFFYKVFLFFWSVRRHMKVQQEKLSLKMLMIIVMTNQFFLENASLFCIAQKWNPELIIMQALYLHPSPSWTKQKKNKRKRERPRKEESESRDVLGRSVLFSHIDHHFYQKVIFMKKNSTAETCVAWKCTPPAQYGIVCSVTRDAGHQQQINTRLFVTGRTLLCYSNRAFTRPKRERILSSSSSERTPPYTKRPRVISDRQKRRSSCLWFILVGFSFGYLLRVHLE